MEISKWDKHFLRMARETAGISKDPSTKVGAIAVKDRVILSTGYNGFPRGMADDDRLGDRESKLKFVVHAEENCVFNAGRIGAKMEGSTLYVWGLPTCHDCAKAIVQAGVKRVVACHDVPIKDSWVPSCDTAFKILWECGVQTSNYPKDVLDQ